MFKNLIRGLMLALLMGLTVQLYAQTDPVIEDSDIQALSVNGSVGFSAQAYTASGIENRRAPGLAQGTANVNFSSLGFSSGINILYSTDQSKLRQNMNQLGFDASWRWLQVSGGDVSPDFSTYGLRGITIRGGHIQLDPGRFLFEVAGGRSQRAVRVSPEEGFREPAFERWTVAGKLGIGQNNNTHFHLSTHYSIDDSESLENGGEITPQENLTVTPDLRVNFFGGRVSLQSEVTASAFTRDIKSKRVPMGNFVPGFVQNLYKPTTSTRLTYAGEAQAELSLQRFGVTAGYERIQPGYRSLGLSRTRDDQQRIQLSPAVNFFENRLNVSANLVLGRDNLLGNRLQTQSNQTIGTNIQASVSEQLMLNASYNLFTNDISTDDPGQEEVNLVDQQQNSHTIMLQPTLTFMANERTHNVSVTGSYMTMDNKFSGGNMQDMNSKTLTTALSYSLTFPVGLSVNTSGNYLTNNSDQFSSNTIGMNLGTGYAFFDRSLSLNFNAGMNHNTNERQSTGEMDSGSFKNTIRQVTLNINAGYQLSSQDNFNLMLRSRNNTAIEGTANNYSEMEASFRYQRAF